VLLKIHGSGWRFGAVPFFVSHGRVTPTSIQKIQRFKNSRIQWFKKFKDSKIWGAAYSGSGADVFYYVFSMALFFFGVRHLF
jgi:hypothetical protein